MAKLMFTHDYNPVTDVFALWFFKPGESPESNFITYGVNINDLIIVKIDAKNNELRGIEVVGACENRVNLAMAIHYTQQIYSEHETDKGKINWEEVFQKAVHEHENELQFA